MVVEHGYRIILPFSQERSALPLLEPRNHVPLLIDEVARAAEEATVFHLPSQFAKGWVVERPTGRERVGLLHNHRLPAVSERDVDFGGEAVEIGGCDDGVISAS